MECAWCGVPVVGETQGQRSRYVKHGRIFCVGKKCGLLHRDATARARRPPPEGVACRECGKPADLSKHRRFAYRKTGRAYCSPACSGAYRSRAYSAAMTRTNARDKHLQSARMTLSNPMKDLETRKKVSETLKRLSHRPKERGGNGKPPPIAEQRLGEIVAGLGFLSQIVIRTGQRRVNPFRVPTSYRPDFGNPELKLALEADGPSHSGRKHLDAKKDLFLTGLGWTVLRFTNAQIETGPQGVLTAVLCTISKLKTSTLMSPKVL